LPAPAVVAALPAPLEHGRTAAEDATRSPQRTLASPTQPVLALTAAPHQAAKAKLPESHTPTPAKSGTSAPIVPTYEWAVLSPEDRVPPGLEVRLPVDGSGFRSARIPPSWRLMVVVQPLNEAVRLDVLRSTSLAEVREAVATSKAAGDARRVQELLANDAILAGGVAGDGAWAMTVEQAALFGKRVSCTMTDGHTSVKSDFLGQIAAVEAAVLQVESALQSSCTSIGQARTELAQLEARLEHLQCKGIDSVPNSVLASDEQSAKQMRKEFTRRAELLHQRLGGLFVGLDAAQRATVDSGASALPGETKRSLEPACTATPLLALGDVPVKAPATRLTAQTQLQVPAQPTVHPKVGSSPAGSSSSSAKLKSSTRQSKGKSADCSVS